jgi:lysophospholipase L1-like esterase
MKKHIVCFGDSNTHGYCAEPFDCADGGDRFNESERWTCLLAQALGDEYLVLEEGLGGRTTVFDDPLTEGLSGLNVIFPTLMSHEPVDLLILMLGTNDTKERFGCTAECISVGLERLIVKAQNTECWANTPNILLICPPHILDGLYDGPFGGIMGAGCPEKSRALAPFYEAVAQRRGCAFLDGEGIAEFNRTDCMHLTRSGHAALARKLAALVPQLVNGHE